MFPVRATRTGAIWDSELIFARERLLYWEHEGNRAVRAGDWKLVAKGPAGRWELYDLTRDRVEGHDLAGKHPDKVKELAAKWEAWAKRAKVIPWVWRPEYGRKKDRD